MAKDWFKPIDQSWQQSVVQVQSHANWLWVVKHQCGIDDLIDHWIKQKLCHEQVDAPCGHCPSCLLGLSHPDVLRTGQDDSIGVDAIREGAEVMFRKPTVSQRRIWILDQRSSMTIAAMNALLKVLEEPPQYATIVLMTEQDHLVLPTLKSRVSIWRMPDIDNTVSVHQWLCDEHNHTKGLEETTALFYASGCRPLQVKEWLLKEVNIPVLTFFNQWLGGSNDVGSFMDVCHDDMMLPLIDGFIYLCWQHIRQGKHLDRCHQAYRVAQSIRQEKTSSIVMNASLLKQRWCHELAHI